MSADRISIQYTVRRGLIITRENVADRRFRRPEKKKTKINVH